GDQPGAAPRAPSSEPRYGGNLVHGSAAEPILFNPLYSEDTASADVEQLVFAGLMEVNERIELEPKIAAAPPEVSDDGTVWTYRLRRGVKFHDGVELTAHDVVFTYGVPRHPDY